MKTIKIKNYIYHISTCTTWRQIDLIPSLTLYAYSDWGIEICFLFWGLSIGRYNFEANWVDSCQP